MFTSSSPGHRFVELDHAKPFTSLTQWSLAGTMDRWAWSSGHACAPPQMISWISIFNILSIADLKFHYLLSWSKKLFDAWWEFSQSSLTAQEVRQSVSISEWHINLKHVWYQYLATHMILKLCTLIDCIVVYWSLLILLSMSCQRIATIPRYACITRKSMVLTA